MNEKSITNLERDVALLEDCLLNEALFLKCLIDTIIIWTSSDKKKNIAIKCLRFGVVDTGWFSRKVKHVSKHLILVPITKKKKKSLGIISEY